VHQALEAGRTAPCPEHAGVTSADDHAAVPNSVTPEHHKPDCCKSAKCACLQHAPAAIFVQWIGPVVIEHSDAVTQSHHQLDVMLDQQDGHPISAYLFQQSFERRGLGSVHAGGGFV
jgi:hypothetical protein